MKNITKSLVVFLLSVQLAIPTPVKAGALSITDESGNFNVMNFLNSGILNPNDEKIQAMFSFCQSVATWLPIATKWTQVVWNSSGPSVSWGIVGEQSYVKQFCDTLSQIASMTWAEGGFFLANKANQDRNNANAIAIKQARSTFTLVNTFYDGSSGKMRSEGLLKQASTLDQLGDYALDTKQNVSDYQTLKTEEDLAKEGKIRSALAGVDAAIAGIQSKKRCPTPTFSAAETKQMAKEKNTYDVNRQLAALYESQLSSTKSLLSQYGIRMIAQGATKYQDIVDYINNTQRTGAVPNSNQLLDNRVSIDKAMTNFEGDLQEFSARIYTMKRSKVAWKTTTAQTKTNTPTATKVTLPGETAALTELKVQTSKNTIYRNIYTYTLNSALKDKMRSVWSTMWKMWIADEIKSNKDQLDLEGIQPVGKTTDGTNITYSGQSNVKTSEIEAVSFIQNLIQQMQSVRCTPYYGDMMFITNYNKTHVSSPITIETIGKAVNGNEDNYSRQVKKYLDECYDKYQKGKMEDLVSVYDDLINDYTEIMQSYKSASKVIFEFESKWNNVDFDPQTGVTDNGNDYILSCNVNLSEAEKTSLSLELQEQQAISSALIAKTLVMEQQERKDKEKAEEEKLRREKFIESSNANVSSIPTTTAAQGISENAGIIPQKYK